MKVSLALAEFHKESIVRTIHAMGTDAVSTARSHGFVLGSAGWSLSSAYDMNPVGTGEWLGLNLSEDENAQDLALARDVAKPFRVKAAMGVRCSKSTTSGLPHAR